jgi:hypothetical protein
VVVEGRRYPYVGPEDVRSVALGAGAGRPIRSRDDFDLWVRTVDGRELAEPFTFVVDPDGFLRLASRRSEHVACAGGGQVLCAGEIAFEGGPAGWAVNEVTNQSTGYCPDTDSWPAVAAAIERAGLTHPGGFTSAFVFRRCPRCHQHNVVKEFDFVCAVCGSDLPAEWNLDPAQWS